MPNIPEDQRAALVFIVERLLKHPELIDELRERLESDDLVD